MLNQKLGQVFRNFFNTKDYDKINFENRVRFITIY
jgi:hypothetical protein